MAASQRDGCMLIEREVNERGFDERVERGIQRDIKKIDHKRGCFLSGKWIERGLNAC